MIKILITGGAGFIGSALAEKLIQLRDFYVVLADNLSTGKLNNLPAASRDNWKFINCDVNEYSDISEIMLAYRFDFVFHYAAMVGVARTQKNPHFVLRDIDGIRNICQLCKNSGVKRIFYSSSSEIYGESVEFPQHAYTTPLNSRLPYAVVKNVGEAFLRAFHQMYDLDYTIFRFFNTYGSKQSQDFVVSRFIRKALDNADLEIYGDGNQTRTFCYIDDNIDACLSALQNHLLVNDVVNIGNNNEVRIAEVAETIIKLAGSQSKIVHLPPLPDGDMRRRCPDNKTMREALLTRPLISLEDGVNRILKTMCGVSGRDNP